MNDRPFLLPFASTVRFRSGFSLRSPPVIRSVTISYQPVSTDRPGTVACPSIQQYVTKLVVTELISPPGSPPSDPDSDLDPDRDSDREQPVVIPA